MGLSHQHDRCLVGLESEGHNVTGGGGPYAAELTIILSSDYMHGLVLQGDFISVVSSANTAGYKVCLTDPV